MGMFLSHLMGGAVLDGNVTNAQNEGLNEKDTEIKGGEGPATARAVILPPNGITEVQIEGLLKFCEFRLPGFQGADAIKDIIQHRQSVRDDDLDFMKTLKQDGYGDIVKCIYATVPEFWPKFELYCKNHDFCWKCAHDPKNQCPVDPVHHCLKPTEQFVIKFKTVVYLPTASIARPNQHDFGELKRYWVSSWMHPERGLANLFTACSLCVEQNAHLFLNQSSIL